MTKEKSNTIPETFEVSPSPFGNNSLVSFRYAISKEGDGEWRCCKTSVISSKTTLKEWSNKEIVSRITADVTASTNAKIEHGFYWKGMKVWLPIENQLNYRNALDLGDGALPYTAKFDNDVLYTFETMEELMGFVGAVAAHVHAALMEKWRLVEVVGKTTFVAESSTETLADEGESPGGQ